MNIIQGQNSPLLFEITDEFDEMARFSAVLTQYGKTVKEWDESSVMIGGNILTLPLSEAETMELSAGAAALDIKIYDNDRKIVFFGIIRYQVLNRLNKHRFEEAET